MKKIILAFSFLLFFGGKNIAQVYSYCPGDSVYLGLPSYTGTLQWQESSDSLNWTDISGATFSPYGFIFSSSKYYRAKVTAPNCNPVYSSVRKAQTASNCGPQYPAGSVFCNGPTAIVDVINPATGKTWMDRNLGASQVATSSTDLLSYGDLYQWGRGSDGHQCRTSATTSTLSSTDQPGNGNFILGALAPYDWRNPQNTNLWQGVNGINNPCPTGYRLPTETELDAERATFGTQNSAGAFASPLKMTASGYRTYNSGAFTFVGSYGFYWSSTVNSTDAQYLIFTGSAANMNTNGRSQGYSVRCIKEPGSVGSLNCGSSTVAGNLISGQPASNVSVSVPYTGGNGDFFYGQSIASTGVTGLTATIGNGNFAIGNGTLTYNITGTPATNGTASIAINIGGQACTLSVSVVTLASMYPAGSVFCNGPTAIFEVTNPATGRTWMDRNLGATQVATSSTDANAYGDLYQWGRGSDGHQCRTSTTTTTLSSTDQPGNSSFIITSIAPNDWRSPQNTSLWQGINGINNPCANGFRVATDAEWNSEGQSFISQNSSGAFLSPLKFSLAGSRNFSTGTLNDVGMMAYYWTSTISNNSSRDFYFTSISNSVAFYPNNRSNGFTIRCIKENVGTIGSINCSGATVNGNLISGQAASNVTVIVPYTGGNGGFYAGQSISSSGVTGLTASTPQGLFANGSGNLTYSITGTPSTNGTASFAINIGGQTCTLNVNVSSLAVLYPAGSVFCNGPTAIVDVTNPATGKIWMDRNLGASQVATSSTDANSYGDLYQWGRGNDGHQCRNSSTTTTLSSSDQPGNSSFILSTGNGSTAPFADWRNPQNTNLWQGVNGVNNPCPTGYRLPTETELDAERAGFSTQNSSGAFNSVLKFSIAGYRYLTDGLLTNVGTWGIFSTSTINGNQSRILYFNNSNAYMTTYFRAYGCSVRCIKN